jgi:NADPH-dependent 2,4-dienoyl-CoA reductase/sulfur reductase-like enzyme
MAEQSIVFDVLIVGGGPGGIAAAVTAAEAGKSVGLIDDNAFPGGQIWRNRGAASLKATDAKAWIARLSKVLVSADTQKRGHKPFSAEKAYDPFFASAGVTWLGQSRVVARTSVFEVLVETPDGARVVGWKSLILATGARELFLPFPGWTLPGVVGAGAIQALMKQGLPMSGKRVIVAGTGPLLLAVADLLRSNGAKVPVILEQATAASINRFAVSLVRSPAKLLAGIGLRARLLGSRYSTDSYPLRASRVLGGLKVDCRIGSREESVECDYLACGFNLIPSNELPQVMGCELTTGGVVRVDGRLRTTAANVFAIGEVTGVGGVEKAIVEGRIAAHAVAGDDEAARSLALPHAAALDFARRLDTAFALRPELLKLAEPATIICRCEDVPLAVVQQSINARDAKLQTRCGMGPCQGRVCGPIIQRLLGCEAQQVRPPVFATTIGALALDKTAAGRP